MTFPRPLTLRGKAEFEEGTRAPINGDVVVDDRLSGRSRLVGNGVRDSPTNIYTRVFAGAHAAAANGTRQSDCSIVKLGGALSGNVTVNGSTAGIITAQVTHAR